MALLLVGVVLALGRVRLTLLARVVVAALLVPLLIVGLVVLGLLPRNLGRWSRDLIRSWHRPSMLDPKWAILRWMWLHLCLLVSPPLPVLPTTLLVWLSVPRSSLPVLWTTLLLCRPVWRRTLLDPRPVLWTMPLFTCRVPTSVSPSTLLLVLQPPTLLRRCRPLVARLVTRPCSLLVRVLLRWSRLLIPLRKWLILLA